MEAPVQERPQESDEEMFNPDWGGDFFMPESPQNEPPPLQLALTDDCVPLPPAGLALVLLKKDEGHEHNHASSLVMSASWTK